jgi:hypothetical protein
MKKIITFGGRDYVSRKDYCRIVLKDDGGSHIEIVNHWKSESGRNMSKFSVFKLSNEEAVRLVKEVGE